MKQVIKRIYHLLKDNYGSEKKLNGIGQKYKKPIPLYNFSKNKSCSIIITFFLCLIFNMPFVNGQQDINNGPGGPILIITDPANSFSRYYVEILRSEGLNAFDAKDIAGITTTDLNAHEVVILGEISLNESQVTMLTNWVTAGGTLIAMRPNPQLNTLMGVTQVNGTLSDQYLLVNTATEQGRGIVNQTIQFHSAANLYTLNGSSSLAKLYSSVNTASAYHAVTLRNVGSSGGQAIAFAYDLAKSVVYTRQGNPAWARQERDGITPIRSDDQYFGNASFDSKPDWINLDKVAIPQADEQIHLLTNIILKGNADKKPLPRFWFLPKGHKAVVVMTGDDHNNGGTAGRFNQYKALSSSNTQDAVDNWTAIRGSSYMFPNTPMTNAEAQAFQDEGFELGLHPNTNCGDWATPAALQDFFSQQLAQLSSRFPSIAGPFTNRTHCLVWSDWSTHPEVELNNRIRLDVNYYYWPGYWLQNRPGMFSGSGMPMRFAKQNGNLIDCYQVPTQMTDESEQVFPGFVEELLDKAQGPEGYYGVFCANMHTDVVASTGSDAIVNAAFTRKVPVIAARQMLTWLDGRNSSTFSSMTWNNNVLSFSVTAASGARNLEAMLPVDIGSAVLQTITVNGSPLNLRFETIKGIKNAFFPATSGNYVATYSQNSCATLPAATLKASVTDCQRQSIALSLKTASGQVPYQVVVNGVTYSNVRVTENFATLPTTQSIWGNSGTPANLNDNDGTAITIGVKFRASQNGSIAGIRFYKGSLNTGTHTGSLWSSTGTKLASAVFTAESASGWQEVRFTTPVNITANTTYIAGYLSPNGTYSSTEGAFSSGGVTNGALTALASGVDGNNGVYIYSNAFPNSSYNASNYWVDVLFKPASYTFNLTSITDANGCKSTGNLNSVTITQSELNTAQPAWYRDVDGDSYGNTSVTVNACTAPAGYVARGGDCNDNNSAIKPGMAEICNNGIDDNCDGRIDEGCNVFYQDLDRDGYGNQAITITAGTPPVGFVADKTDCNDNDITIYPGALEVCDGKDNNCDGRVDEGCSPVSTQSIWGNTGNPLNQNDFDGATITLAVKFRASESGSVLGVRFYKGSLNTGTHIGSLWTSTGTKLASAVFVNETVSGWQEVYFSEPVSIAPNTTYIASYYSESGRYASTEGGFSQSGVTNGALTALQSGVDGLNGTYQYGDAFPNQSYNASNYWVDVLFAPSTSGSVVQTEARSATESITSEKLAVQIMPNPSASNFTLLTQSAANGSITIRVFDALGKLIETKRGIAANGSLRIGHNYRSGVYYAEVAQGKQKLRVKLVKLSK